MEKRVVLDILMGEEYYTIEDLRYNQKIGFKFSKDRLNEFFTEKEKLIEDGNEKIRKLPLKTFNSKFLYYVEGGYIQSKMAGYTSVIIDDFLNDKSFLERNVEDILISKLFSEVEGTLNIENVPTTHKRIKEVFNSAKLTDKNDVIIKNMQNAINFIVKEKPAFNKDNLYKLYSLLSKDCLDQEDKIKEGQFYRDDVVSIGGFEGAPTDKIGELMDSLFEFANSKKHLATFGLLLPHICHYYMLYVHPYFDYNGRTARMVSFWLSVINDMKAAPLYMSEAINENKKEYYKALTNTRITGNDLTYFLGYILDCAIKFNFVYKNLEEIKKSLSKKGEFLNSTELTYIKKIIVHNPEDYFNYKMFLEYINATMSKQAGLKILNHLTEYGILIKTTNKKKEAVFKLNQNFITYKFS